MAHHGADIDDTSALVAKKLRRLLCRQQQAQHVDVEMPVKVLFRDLLERQKIIDAGIVDQNVQPAERLLRLWKIFFTSAAFATSPCTAIALPPLALMSATTRSAPALLEA